MQLKQLLTDDRAVSPVIGVILMVAITVILAAVIGTFVLGLGQNVQSTPQASFSFDFNDTSQNVTVTHNGGDRLQVGDNTQSVNLTGGNYTHGWLGDGGGYNVSDSLSAGDSSNPYGYDSGNTIRVVWVDANGESSATLGQQEAPA